MVKPTKKILVIALLAGMAGGLALSVRAAETPATQPTQPPASQQQSSTEPKEISGTVLAVDKKAMTITVVVNNKANVLKLTPTTKIVKAGEFKTIDEVLVGEEVRLLARETEGGRFEVVGLTVLPSNAASTAAGARPTGIPGQGKGPGNGKNPNNAPFQNFPNPANVGGPIISGNQ
jgi:hypothetical protein